MATRVDPRLRVIPEHPAVPAAGEVVESYRRLADVFHEILAEQSLDALLVLIADTLAELIPHDTLTIYTAEEAQRLLTPVLARDEYADEIMRTQVGFDEGITGWAASNREAAHVDRGHLDPRVRFVPGTPIDPEALISIPLIARSQIQGRPQHLPGRRRNVLRAGVRASEALRRRGGARARQRADPRAARALGADRFPHRPVQPPRLPRATAARAAGGERDASPGRRADARPRRLQAHQRRARARRRRRAAPRACRHDACLRPPARRRLPPRRRGVRRDHERVRRRRRAPRRRTHRRAAARPRLPRHRRRDRLRWSRARPGARDEPARARRVRGSGDDDGEGAREGPHRPVRRDRDAAARGARARRALARAQRPQLVGDLLADAVHVVQPVQLAAEALEHLHVFVVDGKELVPIAFRGELSNETLALPLELLRGRVGHGITGRCAELGEPLLIGDAANCEFGHRIPGTPVIEESLLAVPLRYGASVVGVIVVSKLGLDQFDEDDLRLLDVLAAHAAVSVENARLYDAARREDSAASSS